jgi:hypothetical protein
MVESHAEIIFTYWYIFSCYVFLYFHEGIKSPQFSHDPLLPRTYVNFLNFSIIKHLYGIVGFGMYLNKLWTKCSGFAGRVVNMTMQANSQ